MKETIIKYLKYLRDVSRKIGTRTYLENIFIKVSSKKRYFITQLKEDFLFYNQDVNKFTERNLVLSLKNIYKYLEKNSDKKLFLGLGIICGTEEIAGPLLYIKCDLYIDENNGKLYLELDLSSLTLNYDLISKIVERKNFNYDEDEFVEEIEQESETISIIENFLINKISNIYDKLLEELDYNLIEELYNLTVDIFLIFHKKLYEFKEIQYKDDIEEEYNYDIEIDKYNNKENSLFRKNKLIFFPAFHFFVSSIPSEISTYKSLSLLIEEIENNSKELVENNIKFSNEILTKIFLSVFNNNEDEENNFFIFDNNLNHDTIKNMIDTFIPISISKSQLIAILNAFIYKLSYTFCWA